MSILLQPEYGDSRVIHGQQNATKRFILKMIKESGQVSCVFQMAQEGQSPNQGLTALVSGGRCNLSYHGCHG